MKVEPSGGTKGLMGRKEKAGSDLQRKTNPFYIVAWPHVLLQNKV